MPQPRANAPARGITLAELAARPVATLHGVGERRAAALARIGIRSVLDLLTHYPRRFIDRTNEATVAGLVEGVEALVVVQVRSVTARRARTGRTLVQAEVGDETGRLRVVFFNQPWREQQLRTAGDVALFGKPERYQGRLQMTNPVVDLLGDRTGRIVPVYPQSDRARVYTWDLGRYVAEALRRSSRGFDDPLPEEWRARLGVVDRDRALRAIHSPDSMADVAAARQRLVLDELLRIQVTLVARKRELEREARGIVHRTEGELLDRFLQRLPFPLTGAQRRAIGEIATDLASPHPMHRLLQGDVGAGKTVVAVHTLLVAVQGGHQGVLMAPTEVLAEQHALGVRALLDGLTVPDEGNLLGDRPLRVELLTGRTPAADRRRILAGLADGSVDIAIGTHALIEEAVRFASLGAVVIDEQHRFGVDQRAVLRDKGGEAVPDVLVMTATPIPRTAAMTVYGDLDLSVLDELPPGRSPIKTRWAAGAEAEVAVWDDVRAAVSEGHQAYVVCPLVEESEKLEAASAEETYDRLAAGELRGLRLGLLHGRMTGTDKAAVFEQFRAGALDVLVSTTVIEVGVDVPNATVMVVLDADRFGIAQLHQLRGRVGRGSASSRCWLVTGDVSERPDAEQRLAALVRSTDGFELAEVDLELRGEGTIMGERQKGRNDLKLASLRRDGAWVQKARDVAFALVDDPDAADLVDVWRGELRLFVGDEDADYLFKS